MSRPAIQDAADVMPGFRKFATFDKRLAAPKAGGLDRAAWRQRGDVAVNAERAGTGTEDRAK